MLCALYIINICGRVSEKIYEGLVERGMLTRRRGIFQSQRNRDRDLLLGVIAISLIVLAFLVFLLVILKIVL